MHRSCGSLIFESPALVVQMPTAPLTPSPVSRLPISVCCVVLEARGESNALCSSLPASGKPIDVHGDFLQDCDNVHAAVSVRCSLVGVPSTAPAIGLGTPSGSSSTLFLCGVLSAACGIAVDALALTPAGAEADDDVLPEWHLS